MVRGGTLRSFEDVAAVLDRMDYMMQALQAFPAFMAKCPQHRQTRLALKFSRMTEAERDAGFGIARHLSKGTLVAASATTTSTRLCTALCTRRTSSINRVPGGRLIREFLFSWTTFSEQ